MITGPLDAELFRKAWELVVARHAILRTAPAWQGLKKPVQVVRRAIDLPWEELDWREVPPEDRASRRDALLAEGRRRGFELAKPPLMRLQLARLKEQEWFFAWTCHHFALDGWSAGIVLREVFAFYEQLRQGLAPVAGACGSFGDYVRWLAAQNRNEADRFWHEQLANLGPIQHLPVEEQAQTCLTAESKYGECQVRIDARRSASFQQLALAQRVSQSVLVQAVWAILLARYTEAEEAVFGVTVSGRPSQVSHVDSIVGPLVNNVPLRVRVALDDTLPDLFGRLRAAHSAAQPFEHCSSQQIADAAGLPRGRLFDSLVVFENYPLHAINHWQAADVVVRDVHGTATSNYPLTLVVLPGREIDFRMLFDAERYSAETARRLLEQTVALLHRIIAHPDARIRDLNLAEQGLETARTDTCSGPTLRILDSADAPTPVGMPGALWVEETDRTGTTRWRNTGYRAAWQADGQVEYLGPVASRRNSAPAARIGRYSIDPNEVEAVLQLHPLVDRVAVVCSAERDRGGRLAAFVIPQSNSQIAIAAGGHALAVNELRRYLVERLPGPMVPMAWRAVDSLPVDGLGNVDRILLPASARLRDSTLRAFVSPRDALEARVAAIWSQVLGVEPVGATDGFLELGGHSSLAVALIARLEEEFGRRLPLAALAEEPTVEHLARLLRAAANREENGALVPIRPRGSQLPLFCVHPAGGTVFCYMELAQYISSQSAALRLAGSRDRWHAGTARNHRSHGLALPPGHEYGTADWAISNLWMVDRWSRGL